MPGALFAIAAVIVFALWLIVLHRGVVGLRRRCLSAYAPLDAHLRQRHKLIARLVEIAHTDMADEGGDVALLGACGKAQDAARRVLADPACPTAMRELARAEAALAGHLTRLALTIASNHPLGSSEPVQQLARALAAVERDILFACHAYNDAVIDYNARIARFPGRMVAAPCGFAAWAPLHLMCSTLWLRREIGGT